MRGFGNGWNHVESLFFGGANMNGYQITFFTLQDRRHHGKPVGEWLIDLAKEMGLRGATLIQASESFGHHGRLHSAHFFELTDQPLEVVMAVSSEQAERLFDRLKLEGIHIFYVKSPVEYGFLGEADA
jgi:PII-like signaling protein